MLKGGGHSRTFFLTFWDQIISKPIVLPRQPVKGHSNTLDSITYLHAPPCEPCRSRVRVRKTCVISQTCLTGRRGTIGALQCYAFLFMLPPGCLITLISCLRHWCSPHVLIAAQFTFLSVPFPPLHTLPICSLLKSVSHFEHKRPYRHSC